MQRKENGPLLQVEVFYLSAHSSGGGCILFLMGRLYKSSKCTESEGLRHLHYTENFEAKEISSFESRKLKLVLKLFNHQDDTYSIFLITYDPRLVASNGFIKVEHGVYYNSIPMEDAPKQKMSLKQMRI